MEKKIKYVDITTITEIEIIELIKGNHKTAVLLRDEIKNLEQAQQNMKKESLEFKQTEYQEELEEIIDEDSDEYDFEKEVQYYIEDLKNLPVNCTEEDIIEILPVTKNYNYEKIINRLRLEIIKNMNEINEFIAMESESISEEELKEFKDEIISEKTKLQILKSALLSDNKTSVEEKIENKLIFVPTSGGAPRVLEEIEHIAPEYYEGFLGLFQSIVDGTFKGVERFASTNNALSGISKVKDFKIRVAFDRIDKDKYAVITAFTKKSDNAKSYLAPLKVKVAHYRKVAPKLKELIKDESFLEENEKYQERLFEILNQKEKVK